MGTVPKVLIHLLNEHQVAEMLGVSAATVRRWRLLKQGPRYLKLGALCKYRIEDISAFLESRLTGGAAIEATEPQANTPEADPIPEERQ
jgi:predicted DNA-binding transcriptional regulator AlpA